MLAAGIVLFLLGAIAAYLTEGKIEQLSVIVAIIGVAVIVLWALLAVLDGADTDVQTALLLSGL